MTYIQQFRASQDVALQAATQQAILVAAAQVTIEPGTTTNHANRLTLAHNVVNNPDSYMVRFVQAIVSDGSIIPASVTDAQILSRVLAVWDSIAGTV